MGRSTGAAAAGVRRWMCDDEMSFSMLVLGVWQWDECGNENLAIEIGGWFVSIGFREWDGV